LNLPSAGSTSNIESVNSADPPEVTAPASTYSSDDVDAATTSVISPFSKANFIQLLCIAFISDLDSSIG